MRYLAVALIRFYQSRLRAYHNRQCIYNPSCSEYACLAIQKYGFLKGLHYGRCRIKRCNGAMYEGGEDWP